jgi:hypothetical protein
MAKRKGTLKARNPGALMGFLKRRKGRGKSRY